MLGLSKLAGTQLVKKLRNFTQQQRMRVDQAIDDYNHRKASAQRLTPQHREILKELISVLELVVEATLKTERVKKPSINCAAPLVLGLFNTFSSNSKPEDW